MSGVFQILEKVRTKPGMYIGRHKGERFIYVFGGV